jgi:nucleotide-binding universal stress UspA family protein
MNQTQRRRILLATDLSARCDRAFERTVLLAREWEARLTVVHVLERHDEQLDHGSNLSWRRTDCARLIAESKILDGLQRAGIVADVVVRRGSPADVIVRLARDMSCDLIVTGIARNASLARAILGSTLEALARERIAPVLIVKCSARSSYRSAVVGMEFSKGSRAAIQATVELFPETIVTTLHAYRSPLEGLGAEEATDNAARRHVMDECIRFVTDAVPAKWQEIRCLTERGWPEMLLNQYALDREVDLIAVGTETRNSIATFLLGSVSRSLILSSPCDLLLVPAEWTLSARNTSARRTNSDWRAGSRTFEAETYEAYATADAQKAARMIH